MEFRGGAQTMSTDGERRRAHLPGLDENRDGAVLYYTVYPNLFLSLHPDYVMAHTLWPHAVDRTQVICEWHFHRRKWRRRISGRTTWWNSGTRRTGKMGNFGAGHKKGLAPGVRARTVLAARRLAASILTG